MEDFSRPPSSAVPTGTPLGPLRPGTAFRPPSSIRSGTASRLAAAASSMGPPPTASAQRIGTLGVAGAAMLERPITQHGLSGLSTASGRVGTAAGQRQVKDRRYWQGVVQMKIQEISLEAERLARDKKTLERDQSARKMYEKRIKESAKELSNLQAQLTDMNLALDGYSSGFSRQQMQSEASGIRERNESVQTQLEGLFTQRQAREEANRRLEEDIARERHKVTEMIYALAPAEQQQYRELQSLSEELKGKTAALHDDIEAVTKQRDRMMASLASSQPRLEAFRLQSKLAGLLAKRASLRDEEATRLSPAQEREKLITEVRANNQALTSLSRQLKLTEDQLNEKRELLLQVEHDLEEGNSDRHAKYRELKRRDETMTAFLDTFPQAMSQQKQKIETLKNQIAYAIEQMTLQGINLRGLARDGRGDIFGERNDLTSQGGLLKEYKKLSIQLRQLQILEKRTQDQHGALKKEEMELSEEISKFSNLDSLRSEAAENMSELTSRLEELRNKKRVTEGVLEESRKRSREIKESLRSNETYRQIAHLEEKLTDLRKESKMLRGAVEENRKEFNYADLKRTAMENLGVVMKFLTDNSSNLYI
ncbi:intraflagellar transport protein 74 homolog [Lutzomyia longipalpis]|uniref:intraflagellar transport protein 74 homolog n=1 Tax=Lutzomyia longipalpis TaxID=7200 RepID=UPI002484258D|nr:intraflagellar transport protein 74 homolog [Lutzomyia longipalpis]